MKSLTAVCQTGASMPAMKPQSGRVSRPPQHRGHGENAEMKMYLSKLKDLVPFMPKNRKLSKLEIIQHVIDYICELQTELESHPDIDQYDGARELLATPNRHHLMAAALANGVGGSTDDEDEDDDNDNDNDDDNADGIINDHTGNDDMLMMEHEHNANNAERLAADAANHQQQMEQQQQQQQQQHSSSPAARQPLVDRNAPNLILTAAAAMQLMQQQQQQQHQQQQQQLLPATTQQSTTPPTTSSDKGSHDSRRSC